MRRECNNCGKVRCAMGDHDKFYSLDCERFEAPPPMLNTMVLELACSSNISGVAMVLSSLKLQVNPKYDGRNELIIDQD